MSLLQGFSLIVVFIFFSLFLFSMIVVLRLHYDIYKSFYSISLLNSPPLFFSFIPLSHHSWNSFSRSHSNYTHEYILSLHSPSHTLSLYPPPSHNPSQNLIYLPVLHFLKNKTFFFV
jgi:hypothetical protein